MDESKREEPPTRQLKHEASIRWAKVGQKLKLEVKTVRNMRSAAVAGGAGGSIKESGKQWQRYENFWNGVKHAVDSLSVRQVDKSRLRSRHREYEVQEAFSIHSLRKNYLLHPSGKLKSAWDAALCVFTLGNCLYIPFNLAFGSARGERTFDTTLQSLATIFYFFDMVMTANTAIIDQLSGILVTTRLEIFQEYAKFWLWFDLLSTFPCDLIYRAAVPNDHLTSSHLELLRMIRFVKLVDMTRLRRFLPSSTVLGIALVLSVLLLLCHTIGCFWWYIGRYNAVENPFGYPSSWIEALTLPANTVLDQYIASTYWAMYTMITIGYGDIVATNTSERMFVIAVGMIGAIVLGVIIDNVTRLVERSNPQARVIDKKILEFRAYLKEGGQLSDVLKSKAIQAYHYYQQRKSNVDTTDEFEGLPPKLTSRLITSIYGSVINNVLLFRHVSAAVGKDFVVNLIMKAKPYANLAGEVISEVGDMADHVNFVLRGSVQLTSVVGVGDRVVVEGFATQGYYFGDFEYYIKSTRVVSFTAYSDCDLISVTYNELKALCSKYEEAGAIVAGDISHRSSTYKITNRSEPLEVARLGLCRESMWLDGRLVSVEQTLRFLEEGSHTKMNTVPVITKIDANFTVTMLQPLEFQTQGVTDSEILRRGFLHPGMTVKIAWDVFNMLLTIVVIFATTVQIAYERAAEEHGWYEFSAFASAVFFADILLSFITAYKHSETNAYVLIHRSIAEKYLKGMFTLDLISSIPYDQISLKGGGAHATKIVQLLRLAKLLRTAKLVRTLRVMKAKLNLDPTTVKVFTLLLQVLATNHFVCCLWWACSFNFSTSSSWIDNSDMVYHNALRDASLLEQYVVSAYWSVITLLGIGYGDIVASNTSERCLNILIVLFGSSLFAYVMAKVSEILQRTHSAEARLLMKISNAREYLVEKNIPHAVKDSILKFIEVKAIQTSLFNEKELLSCLPQRLSSELFLLHRTKVLQRIPIFDHISNKSVALHIFNLLHVSYFDKFEYVFKEGEFVNEIKFVVTGKGALYTRASKRVTSTGSRSHLIDQADLDTAEDAPSESDFFLGEVSPGDFFGHDSVMNWSRGICSLYTLAPCSIYSLHKSSVIALLKEHPSAGFNLQAAFIEAIRIQKVEFEKRNSELRRHSLFSAIDTALEESQVHYTQIAPRTFKRVRKSSFSIRRFISKHIRKRRSLGLKPLQSYRRRSVFDLPLQEYRHLRCEDVLSDMGEYFNDIVRSGETDAVTAVQVTRAMSSPFMFRGEQLPTGYTRTRQNSAC